jgi:tetratricopeptide (TPR) repeat protein
VVSLAAFVYNHRIATKPEHYDMDLLNRRVLAFSSKNNREMIRKTLAAGNFKVSFINALSEVSAAISEFGPTFFVHDWAAVEASQTRQFHLKFASSVQATEIIRILLVQEITPSILAFANDALIERVFTYGSASLNLGAELDMVAARQDSSELAKLVREVKTEDFEYDQNSIDERIEHLYQKFPHDTKVKLEFGNLSFRRQKYDVALSLAQDIVNREAHNMRAMNLVARCLMKKGDFQKAFATLSEASVLSPANPERLIMMGDALYGSGDLDEAIDYYQEALDIEPELKPEAGGKIGQIRLEQGQLEDALDLFKNSVSEEEAAGFFNNAAVKAVRDGHPQQALKLYETALKALKTDKFKPLIYFNISLSHRRLGNIDEALESIRSSLRYDENYEKARSQLEQLMSLKKSS